jgi:aminopeptidase
MTKIESGEIVLIDNRFNILANTIVNYSLSLKLKETVLITCQSIEPKPLVKCIIDEIYKAKAIPFLRISDEELTTRLTEKNNNQRIELIKRQAEFDVDNYDAFIDIRYRTNDYEPKDIDKEILKDLGKALMESHDIKINKRKWILLNFPSILDAYKAKMKHEEYYNYALDVMTIDYSAMNDTIAPLKKLMEKTDKVRITGVNTDITFSIKNMPVIPCVGEKNIPDGEIFTAPIKKSINGYITYNTPSPYQGNIYNNVKLVFKDGKIIEASCAEDNDELNKIFDTDEGSRYVGEFSIGLNPKIKYPMGDILYDEKIIGSLHFTPGRCYEECNNNNQSSIHWDMVLIQNKEYGGGNIYFDDQLIRKDGLFVLNTLQHLN